MSSERMPCHVVISSYACDPVEGSEPGVGWQIFRAAVGAVDRVTLVTRTNNVDKIVNDEAARGASVVGFDLKEPWVSLKRKVPYGTQLYYWLWQLGVRKVLLEIHESAPADVVHHATFAVDWTPVGASVLASRAPLVWGPVGGATTCPTNLRGELGPRGIWSDWWRDLMGALGRRTHGRKAASSSSLTIAQNSDDARAFRSHAIRLVTEPNAFIDLSTLPVRRQDEIDPHLIVGVGRLIGWKGWSLALKTLAQLPPDFRLEIYGTGPDRRRLERLAAKLKVSHRVAFMGWCPREATYLAVATARCVVHPSLHDSAPGSVAEALSIGCPVVCLDVGGAAEMVRLSGGGGVVDPSLRDVPSALALAILEADAPRDQLRWSSDRVDALVRTWYASALEASV